MTFFKTPSQYMNFLKDPHSSSYTRVVKTWLTLLFQNPQRYVLSLRIQRHRPLIQILPSYAGWRRVEAAITRPVSSVRLQVDSLFIFDPSSN